MLLSPDLTTFRGAPQVRVFFKGATFILKPTAHLANGVTKPTFPRLDRRYSLAGALVILAVASGTVLVLLVDWISTALPFH